MKLVFVFIMFGDIEILVIGVCKVIVVNMLCSKYEVLYVWMMIEVDVINFVLYCNLIKGDFKKCEGFNLMFFVFFVKVVV